MSTYGLNKNLQPALKNISKNSINESRSTKHGRVGIDKREDATDTMQPTRKALAHHKICNVYSMLLFGLVGMVVTAYEACMVELLKTHANLENQEHNTCLASPKANSIIITSLHIHVTDDDRVTLADKDKNAYEGIIAKDILYVFRVAERITIERENMENNQRLKMHVLGEKGSSEIYYESVEYGEKIAILKDMDMCQTICALLPLDLDGQHEDQPLSQIKYLVGFISLSNKYHRLNTRSMDMVDVNMTSSADAGKLDKYLRNILSVSVKNWSIKRVFRCNLLQPLDLGSIYDILVGENYN
jgi:hypothetical protein